MIKQIEYHVSVLWEQDTDHCRTNDHTVTIGVDHDLADDIDDVVVPALTKHFQGLYTNADVCVVNTDDLDE